MFTTSLIIVEGIMGSGKSTTSKVLAAHLQAQQIDARSVYEDARGHPVRVMGELPDPFRPWRDLAIDDYIARSLAKWCAFVDQTQRAATVWVFDGQLFHGDLTNLLLMNAPQAQLVDYVGRVIALADRLHPILVYFYQHDLESALQKILAARGPKWEQYQVNWKCQSPYCVQRGLTGLPGLLQLYRDYRRLTDELFAQLTIKKLAIENSAGDWPRYEQQIVEFLQAGGVS